MKRLHMLTGLFLCSFSPLLAANEVFPDGTPVPAWFHEATHTPLEKLGKSYRLTDHGVLAGDSKVQTSAIQAVIDKAYEQGGGVVIVPQGTFLTGSLFFKQGVNLYLESGATLKGSDDISDFALLTTRIEGQTVKYFAALINADGLDGFTLTGKGTIDGNGLRYWKAFWLRRGWNPKCTNKDEQRPRLLYVSHCKNVQISGVSLINSPFWTTHFYKTDYLKIMDLTIKAGTGNGFETRAPSSDGIDLDVCQNVLVKGCYIAVNDDGVCLKGGKGPLADKDPNNGENRNIIVEDNTFDRCPALTMGSESVFTYNVMMRRCKTLDANSVLLFKMRPDTPQKHRYVLVEDIEGTVREFLEIRPWTQFFDLAGQPQPYSSIGQVTLRNCTVTSNRFLNVKSSDKYTISNLTLKDLTIKLPKEETIALDFVKNLTVSNVTLNGKSMP